MAPLIGYSVIKYMYKVVRLIAILNKQTTKDKKNISNLTSTSLKHTKNKVFNSFMTSVQIHNVTQKLPQNCLKEKQINNKNMSTLLHFVVSQINFSYY